MMLRKELFSIPQKPQPTNGSIERVAYFMRSARKEARGAWERWSTWKRCRGGAKVQALFSRDCHEVAFQLQLFPSAPTFSVLVQQKEEANNYPEPRGANSNRPNLDGHI
eukprot:7289598-Prymnesium_polylepis.1